MELAVVGSGAAVAQAAVASGDQPGHSPFGHRTLASVVVLPGGIGGGLLVMVQADGQQAAGGGGVPIT
ncbi:hypothetical protein DP939_34425 [Spongiactinospora rosea]|uniref:Uncharacterized protein n=1 Tax=Spongiactinospora rosea TaxID=2248750 RepID=A0A366LR36_9ACTN|nr:hypothetical protein DP939_34425 [Spongiactinospora rosea]